MSTSNTNNYASGGNHSGRNDVADSNYIAHFTRRLSMSKAAELAKMGEVLTNSQIGGRRNIIIMVQ